EDYKPKGVPPLAQAEDWVNVPCPSCGGPAKREVETMDTFVDSSWYFLRYCDPRDDRQAFDRALVDWWCPIDNYTGGVDHATMHMIYARFFVKALADIGLLGFREPFARFFGNGWVKSGGKKMSKSKGNVIGPDALVERYGADPVRLYILSLGPADQDMEWTEEGVEGSVRFMRRLWRVIGEAAERAPEGDAGDVPLVRAAHRAIAAVTDDLGRRFQFNTPIARIRELVNELAPDTAAPGARFAAETAVQLIQPYAPHVAEELWSRLGHERLWEQPWPVADDALVEHETVELVLQVNGKVRDRVQVPAGLTEDELVAHARASERVRGFLNGGEPRKVIVVPDKLVNFVV
ncbi:MAG TPA: class I tRNA ligase family protein, partial [Gaiellaceae bacterium]